MKNLCSAYVVCLFFCQLSFMSLQTPALGTESQNIPAAELPAGENSELWAGSLYTSTYRVGLCISALGQVRGTLFLRLANGQIDEYHFSGTSKNNHLEAWHPSGHHFSGRFLSHEKVEGEITLKNGMKLTLEGTRKQDAKLDFHDCSPLPEGISEKVE